MITMDILTIIKIAGAIIRTVTISAVAIWWFIQLGANTLADIYKKKIEHDFGKRLESYKSQLEVLKAATLKYRDRQFVDKTHENDPFWLTQKGPLCQLKDLSYILIFGRTCKI
jgi:hypothetical protein